MDLDMVNDQCNARKIIRYKLFHYDIIIMDQNKLFKSFVNDIIQVFPEYKDRLFNSKNPLFLVTDL